MKTLSKSTLRCLAFYQLQLFIEKGENVVECKKEWKRRTLRNYPMMPNGRTA
jgi:hypothetical protein